MAGDRARGIGELIREGERSFSFEFFPPKDEAGEEQLWRAISALEPYRPTFVSVTYGAGGSTRDTTVRVTGRIASETSLTPMAHLTCVGHTRDELTAILASYAAAGVRNVLALRGDPPDGPGHAVDGDRGRPDVRRRAGGAGQGDRRLQRRRRRLPRGAPRGRVARPRRRDPARQAAGGGGVRDHRHVLPGRGLLRPRGPRPRGRGRHPDPARHHADHEPQPDQADGRALRPRGAGRGRGPGRRPRRRPGRRPRRRHRRGRRALRGAARGGAPGLHFYTLNRSKATLEIFAALNVTV